MKLLISRVAPNTRVKFRRSVYRSSLGRGMKFLASDPKADRSMLEDQVIPMTLDPIRFGSAAFAQLPRVAKIIGGILMSVLRRRSMNSGG